MLATTVIKIHFELYLLYLIVFALDGSSSFTVVTKNGDLYLDKPLGKGALLSRCAVLLRGESSDNSEESVPVVDLDNVAASESNDLYSSLAVRITAQEYGIGKRYVCRTQKGFLNVHQEPCDPMIPLTL